MTVRYVNGGDESFNALVYGTTSDNLRSYFRNSLETAAAKIGQYNSQFIENAKAVYDKYNSDLAIARAKSFLNAAGIHIDQNAIIEYNETNIGLATTYMQNYVMAKPTMWELHRNQACEGFDGFYQERDESVTTYEDNPFYRSAMDGVLQFDDDEDGEGYFNTYSSSDDEELILYDKFSILNMWDNISKMIAEGVDPSSITGESL